MNLKSCNGCGVVLDKDKLQFPTELYDRDMGVDEKRAIWNGDAWVAVVPCPVCASPILESA